MAKKITRGITGIKEINKQDFDTNNVNDLLSDGQYNYIHRKKGKSEEYHNLTDNIKTISSDNTDLLTVTNNNKTNNTATLRPKHDSQKEQVLESERATITIKHGTNATNEKTKVDTNPQKVLEHSNLVSGSEYVTIEHEEESEISKIKTDKLKNDMDALNALIAQKQNTLTGNASIGVINNSLQQLYCWYETYTHANGVLKTHVKSVSSNASVTTTNEEFNFILKINQGQQSATFTLREHEKIKFSNIMTTYGTDNLVKINGCLFSLSGDTLTVSLDANTENSYVITFSDIM